MDEKGQARMSMENNKLSLLIHSIPFLSLLILIILSSTSFASLDIGGYNENQIVGIIKRTGGGIPADLNKLRLQFKLVTNRTKIFIEPNYIALYNPQNETFPAFTGTNKLNWNQNYIKINLSVADVTYGKQLISWGMAYLWNPTDVFNAFDLAFANAKEERGGVNAVRVEVPLDPASYIEGISSGSTRAFKGKTNINNYDLAVSYVDLGETGYQVGFETSGELLGLGVRNETAITYPVNSNRYIRSVIGVGYTFEGGWGVESEYFYNGLGRASKDNYDWTGLFSGSVSQLAKHYLYIGINKSVDELTKVSTSFLINAVDRSFIFYPVVSRNLAQNTDLSLEFLFEGGETGTEYQPTSSQDPTGLLGSNIGFMKVRYSF